MALSETYVSLNRLSGGLQRLIPRPCRGAPGLALLKGELSKTRLFGATPLTSVRSEVDSCRENS
jgi:hypothetical protein